MVIKQAVFFNGAISKELKIVLLIQVALLATIGLNSMGADTMGARQAVGFVSLTFVPGFLILRLIGLRRIGIVETVLYSVGISIAFLMFTGFGMNTIYPHLGISRPITLTPLLLTLTIAVGMLWVLAYLSERRESTEAALETGRNPISRGEIISPPVLFLAFLPLLSIVATYYLSNFHQNNLALLLLIGLIAATATLISFDRFIPRKLYPLAIATISISLLWHRSLISQYIVGDDLHQEYRVQALVLSEGVWDRDLPQLVNSVLSVTILPPLYSLILKTSGLWVFKIVYPFLFSLAPLALFQAFRKMFDDRIGFFAAFFFLSFFEFYTDMLGLARQQIAELFLALSVLLLISDHLKPLPKSALLMIFGFALAVSHYGVAYFYLFMLLLALPMTSLLEGKAFTTLTSLLNTNLKQNAPSSSPNTILGQDSTFNKTYVLLFAIVATSWYMYNASSLAFDTLIQMGDHVFNSLNEVVDPETRDPNVLAALNISSTTKVSVQGEIFRIFQWVTHFLVIIGSISLITSLPGSKLPRTYIASAFVSMLLLGLSVALPYVTRDFNTARIYHLTLFFVAPLCIIGGVTVLKTLAKLTGMSPITMRFTAVHIPLLVSLVIVPYFLFNTGFIYQVTGSPSSSLSLSPEKFSNTLTHEPDMVAGTWLSRVDSDLVKADDQGSHILRDYGLVNKVIVYSPSNVVEPWRGVYDAEQMSVFLTSENIRKDEVWVFERTERERKSYAISATDIISAANGTIYDNGANKILWITK